MPRPSWSRYTITPRPASPICRIAACSWSPQSQRREPKTSPVRHLECIRTSTFFSPSTWPITSATCSALVHVVPVAHDAELAERRRQPRIGDAVHQPLGAEPVRHQLRQRHERQVELLRQLHELRAPRHRAVGAQDLADDARRDRAPPAARSPRCPRCARRAAARHPGASAAGRCAPDGAGRTGWCAG